MTGIGNLGALLEELYEAENDLAAEYREVARRTVDEPDIHHMCGTLAGQCDDHSAAVRAIAEQYHLKLANGDPGPRAAARVCRVAVEAAADGHGHGHIPATGARLLGYLRELFLAVERVDLHWIVAGQVAQALRDPEFLARVTALHKQTLTQAKWLKTAIRETAPQVILTS
ncbi:hypothetical protein [Actinomadura rugatobispora]|uniref:DUF892 family protein n=1 Tax=Actinomadura rugatobispora TaxID=1994 RepID=A0ABW0ZZ84_9ACTN|nr:hypothetical protein GCM10010200_077290 [Actinomadura rugatobispora]